MTARHIFKNIMLELGLEYIDHPFTSSEREIQQVIAFMNATGKDVSGRVEWSRLAKEVDVKGDVSELDLPDDFCRMTEKGTVFLKKKGFHPVRLVIAPEQWAFLVQNPSSRTYCHLIGGKICFSPRVSADGAKIHYISKHWVQGKYEIDHDDDVLMIPERLIEKGTIWRWRRQKGLLYDDIFAEAEADLITEIRADRGGGFA